MAVLILDNLALSLYTYDINGGVQMTDNDSGTAPSYNIYLNKIIIENNVDGESLC